VELRRAIAARRMVRAFDGRPVAAPLVDGLIDLARRAPSAGNTQPWAFVVLEGAQTARLWDVTLPPARRSRFRWPGLLDAPVVIVPVVDPEAYVHRYDEPDKRSTGRGAGTEAWPVPYWWVDGGMAVHGLLLAAVDAGLGALFYGLFEHEAAALAALGVPPGRRALGAVALGWPAPDEPGRSSARPRPPLDAVIHRGGWTGGDPGHT
jgi:nitroreductase